MGLTYDDLAAIQSEIMKGPERYPVMRGTGGLRKMRIAIKGRGKSGGARVLYVNYLVYETVYLVSIYAKNVKDNLTPAERNAVKKKLAGIEEDIRRLYSHE